MREFNTFNTYLWQKKQKIEAEIEERQKELERINVQLGFHNPRQSKTRYTFDENGLLQLEPNSSSPNSPQPTPDWSGYKPLSPTRDIKPLTKDPPKPTPDFTKYKNPQSTDEPTPGFPTIFFWLFALLIGMYIISYQNSREQQKPNNQEPNNQGYLMNVPARLG